MKYRWDKKYLYWGITAFVVIVCSISFFLALSNWQDVKATFSLVLKALAPVLYGFVIAYLLNKVLMFFETNLFTKVAQRIFRKNTKRAKHGARILSISLTMLLALLFVGGLLALVLPQIYQSIQKLVTRMPDYVSTAVAWVQKFLSDNPELESTVTKMVGDITDYFNNWLQTSVLPKAQVIITYVTGSVLSAAREVINIVIGIVISIYVMYHKEKFSAQSKKLLYSLLKPVRANGILEKVRFLDKTFGGFIAGKLIDSLIVGLICYIVLAFLNMPYAALISVIIGITNIVPFFGPLIGAIPSSLLILLEDPVKCLIFIIFIVILQQFDGNVLGPKILGNTTGLSGFWIMFAILLFGTLFGLWGLILGVPILAVIYAGLRSFSNRRLLNKNLPLGTAEFENISYINPETNDPVYKDWVKTECDATATDTGKKDGTEGKKDHEKDI